MPLLILVMPFEAFLPSLQDYALSVLVGSLELYYLLQAIAQLIAVDVLFH